MSDSLPTTYRNSASFASASFVTQNHDESPSSTNMCNSKQHVLTLAAKKKVRTAISLAASSIAIGIVLLGTAAVLSFFFPPIALVTLPYALKIGGGFISAGVLAFGVAAILYKYGEVDSDPDLTEPPDSDEVIFSVELDESTENSDAVQVQLKEGNLPMIPNRPFDERVCS